MAISVEELQSLLKEIVPGWGTQRIGDLDDPENVRTPATVLDSLLHAYGEAPTLNIMSEEKLQSLDPRWSEGWEPRASYSHNNTIYGPNHKGQINAYNLKGLIQELAHDIQYRDPQYKAARGEYDKYVGGSDAMDYDTEGALEHEAHSVIEPTFWDLLTKMYTLNKDSTIGSLGSDKYPHSALYEYGEGKYGWPIGDYEYHEIKNEEELIKDGQNQSQTIRPTSSVHDVGKVY
tara:strand:- start:45 stop:743 length:699 start_codon:yes stop_codon:yes gene_type:complete